MLPPMDGQCASIGENSRPASDGIHTYANEVIGRVAALVARYWLRGWHCGLRVGVVRLVSLYMGVAVVTAETKKSVQKNGQRPASSLPAATNRVGAGRRVPSIWSRAGQRASLAAAPPQRALARQRERKKN